MSLLNKRDGTVIKFGNSLGIILTTELAKMGLADGDPVSILLLSDKNNEQRLVIKKSKTNTEDSNERNRPHT